MKREKLKQTKAKWEKQSNYRPFIIIYARFHVIKHKIC